MASTSQHDPIVAKILKLQGKSYQDWANEVLWQSFYNAIEKKNSPIRKQILDLAEEELKNKALEKQFNSDNR